MAVVQTLLSLAILGILYYRMIKREKPEQIGWLQAFVPIALGAVSLSISFYVLIGVASLLNALGISAGSANNFIKSMMFAFLMAGAPEEIAKLIFMVIAIFLFRKKIRNVYEYILIGAAIGIGFTLPEEFGYGDVEAQAIWIRMLTVCGHMIYGIIMAKHIGIAQYNRKNGQPRFLQYVLAICIPVLLHTLYDACTSNNLMMISEDSAESDSGIMLGLIAVAAHFIIQIVVLVLLKKNTEKYCEMALL